MTIQFLVHAGAVSFGYLTENNCSEDICHRMESDCCSCSGHASCLGVIRRRTPLPDIVVSNTPPPSPVHLTGSCPHFSFPEKSKKRQVIRRCHRSVGCQRSLNERPQDCSVERLEFLNQRPQESPSYPQPDFGIPTPPLTPSEVGQGPQPPRPQVSEVEPRWSSEVASRLSNRCEDGYTNACSESHDMQSHHCHHRHYYQRVHHHCHAHRCHRSLPCRRDLPLLQWGLPSRRRCPQSPSSDGSNTQCQIYNQVSSEGERQLWREAGEDLRKIADRFQSLHSKVSRKDEQTWLSISLLIPVALTRCLSASILCLIQWRLFNRLQ